MCFCSRCQYMFFVPTVLGFIPHVDILTEIFPLSGLQGPSVFGWTCAHFGLFTLDNGGRPDLEREESLERFNWVQLAFLNGIRSSWKLLLFPHVLFQFAFRDPLLSEFLWHHDHDHGYHERKTEARWSPVVLTGLGFEIVLYTLYLLWLATSWCPVMGEITV